MASNGLSLIRTDADQAQEVIVRHEYDHSRGSAREYVWTDDALCAQTDGELFVVDQDLTSRKVRALVEEEVEAARKVCVDCPVRQKCLEAATSADLYWTVRGGRLPGRLSTARGVSRRAPSYNITPFMEWRCSEHGRRNIGYRTEKKKSKGEPTGETYRRPYCLDCDREKRAKGA